jgi:hypothetical protein
MSGIGGYALPDVSEYAIRPLSAETWGAFAVLAEKLNGVSGGCWCTWFMRMEVPAGS